MAYLSGLSPNLYVRLIAGSNINVFVRSKTVWLRVIRKTSVFLSVLFFLIAGHPPLAAETSPTDAPAHFHTSRYPFLPSLIASHEPELCSIILERVRQRFFSASINIPPPIEEEDGAAWIQWNVFQEGHFGFRLDLDLEGDGKLHPVIGRQITFPGSRVGYVYRVFDSQETLEKQVDSVDPDKLFEKSFSLEDEGNIRLFRWKNQYYFFDFASEDRYPQLNVPMLSVFRLKGDGSVLPRCIVKYSPDKSIGHELRAKPGFRSFLKVLSTIGKEGSGNRYAHHDSEANAAVDRAAYRPWAVSRATLDPGDVLSGSYHRYDERLKRFLEDWSLLEVWNRREYQTFLHHIDPAVVALTEYYVDVFGIAREEANSAAEGVIEELVAAWIQVPSSYDPEQDLYNIRRPPLNQPLFNRDRAALEEILRQERERSSSDSKGMDRRLKRIDPSVPFSFDRKSPDLEISLALHSAVEWEEGMRLLLSAGADPNTANEFGKTSLMTAAHMNRPDTVRLLLSHGAHPNMKTGKIKYSPYSSPIERTALMYAAENAGTSVMKLLLDAGASPDERDSKGDGIGTYLARNPRLTDSEKKMDIRELVRSREDKPTKPDLDCAKARTSVDKLICGDEVLKIFDREMADAYRRWRRLAGYEARKDQRRWLKERDTSCIGKDRKPNISCLQDQARSRVRYLHNRLAEYALEVGKP
jgi:uncharacterized protein YecT (DUF1311 family)